VIANFVAEYASGRTPIPCVRCKLVHQVPRPCLVPRGRARLRLHRHRPLRDRARDGTLFAGAIRQGPVYFLGHDRRWCRGCSRRSGRSPSAKPETSPAARPRHRGQGRVGRDLLVPDDDYVACASSVIFPPCNRSATFRLALLVAPDLWMIRRRPVVGEPARGFAPIRSGSGADSPAGFPEPMYVVATGPTTPPVVIRSGDGTVRPRWRRPRCELARRNPLARGAVLACSVATAPLDLYPARRAGAREATDTPQISRSRCRASPPGVGCLVRHTVWRLAGRRVIV